MNERFKYSCEDCLNAGEKYVTYDKFLGKLHENRCNYKIIKKEKEIEERHKREIKAEKEEIEKEQMKILKEFLRRNSNT
jgi:hypothetical protein